MKWISLNNKEKEWFAKKEPIPCYTNPYAKEYQKKWNRATNKDRKNWCNLMKDEFKYSKYSQDEYDAEKNAYLSSEPSYERMLEYSGKELIADWCYDFLLIKKTLGVPEGRTMGLRSYLIFRYKGISLKSILNNVN